MVDQTKRADERAERVWGKSMTERKGVAGWLIRRELSYNTPNRRQDGRCQLLEARLKSSREVNDSLLILCF